MTTARKKIIESCCQKLLWEDLDLESIRALIALAISEDFRGSGLRDKPRLTGDPSSELLPASNSIEAAVRARESLTLCGMPVAREILRIFDSQLSLTELRQDGETIGNGEAIAILSGPVRSALGIERTLLNFLQRMSGVATLTRRYADALSTSRTRLLDTRKTTPGYRYLEKYSVACGGGWNHRLGLFDRVMLKDNHLASFGSNLAAALKEAVDRSRESRPDLLVEIEVDSLNQIEAALAAEVDIILLDNFSVPDLRIAESIIGDKAVTEISGNVTLDTVVELGAVGCDFISTGALVHKSVWVDIGLDWH